MHQIVLRLKTYEFRKKLYPSTVERIWFYETSPISSITYICNIYPAHIRSQHGPLPEERGIGNKEYNEDRQDDEWKAYDYAYKVRSCYKLVRPITLSELKERCGNNGAPRGMIYVPGKMMEDVRLEDQVCLWREG